MDRYGGSCIPVELIDVILENLSGDHHTVSACALVCQTWRLPSQRRLFHTLRFNKGAQDLANLPEILKESEPLRNSVRVVSIHFLRDDQWQRSHWQQFPLLVDQLTSILQQLPRPHTLELIGSKYNSRPLWIKFPQDFRNAVKRIFQLATLRNVVIEGWGFGLTIPTFQSLLASKSSLIHLSLRDISNITFLSNSEFDIPSTTVQGPEVHLEEFTFSITTATDGRMFETFCNPLSRVKLDKLKSLRLKGNPEVGEVQPLIQRAAPTLERLLLEANNASIIGTPLSLANNAQLRSLSLECGPSLAEMWRHLNGTLWIADTLESVPELNNLEEINLSIFLTISPHHNLRNMAVIKLYNNSSASWPRINAILSRERFSSLGRIKISLFHHGVNATAYGRLASETLQSLGDKVSWRILEVDFRNEICADNMLCAALR